MEQANLPWKKILLYSIGVFLGVNVVLIDIWIYTQTHTLEAKPVVMTITPIPTPIPFPTIPPTVTPFPTAASTNNATTHPLVSAAPVKEFFVPLGSGETDATDWTDISGAIGYIDSTAYLKIKSAVLEATVVIPNGNETASIRLFNKTDSHPVWFSETSWGGGNTQFIISKPFTLDSGNKLYQVQIKNQLPSMASINNARIHITLQ